MFMEKQFKKKTTNELNMELPLHAEKTGVETHWLSDKEKVPGTTISKKVMLTAFWDLKMTHYNWYIYIYIYI